MCVIISSRLFHVHFSQGGRDSYQNGGDWGGGRDDYGGRGGGRDRDRDRDGRDGGRDGGRDSRDYRDGPPLPANDRWKEEEPRTTSRWDDRRDDRRGGGGGRGGGNVRFI